jgi:hypothetical protein
MSDAERAWHLALDRENVARDREEVDRLTEVRLTTARAVYLAALRDRYDFLEQASRGW